MTKPQERRITGRVSIGALRRATKDLKEIANVAVSVEVEVWNFSSGVIEESVKAFVGSRANHNLEGSHRFSSIEELNKFIHKPRK